MSRQNRSISHWKVTSKPASWKPRSKPPIPEKREAHLNWPCLAGAGSRTRVCFFARLIATDPWPSSARFKVALHYRRIPPQKNRELNESTQAVDVFGFFRVKNEVLPVARLHLAMKSRQNRPLWAKDAQASNSWITFLKPARWQQLQEPFSEGKAGLRLQVHNRQQPRNDGRSID